MCHHCRRWVCKYHQDSHNDDCRGPAAEVALPAGLNGGSVGDSAAGATQEGEGQFAPPPPESGAPPVPVDEAAEVAGEDGGMGGPARTPPQPRGAVTMSRPGAAPRARLSVPDSRWSIYTDGACKENRDVEHANPPAGWGFVVTRSTSAEDPLAGEVVAESCGPVVCKPDS